MRTVWSRVAALFRRRRLDGELSDEVGFHLAMLEEEFRARGMPPAEAKLAARREFGGVAQAQEEYRDRRGIPWLETSMKDARYALRGLLRNPGFTAAAVLSLALGIGANTAIFSLVHALMLRMLPVAHPEQLVYLYRTGGWGKGFVSYPLYLDLARRSDVFDGAAARTGVSKGRFSRQGSDGVEFAEFEYVSGNYFSFLGVGPALGRLIAEEDNRTPKAHPVAVLSYEFWRNRFNADPRALGQTVVVNGQPLQVIGIARAGFRGVEVEHHPDVWAPCMMYDIPIMNAGYHWVWVVARRRPEASRQRVQAVVDAVMQQHLTEHYGKNSDAAGRYAGPGRAGFHGGYRAVGGALIRARAGLALHGGRSRGGIARRSAAGRRAARAAARAGGGPGGAVRRAGGSGGPVRQRPGRAARRGCGSPQPECVSRLDRPHGVEK